MLKDKRVENVIKYAIDQFTDCGANFLIMVDEKDSDSIASTLKANNIVDLQNIIGCLSDVLKTVVDAHPELAMGISKALFIASLEVLRLKGEDINVPDAVKPTEVAGPSTIQ